MHCEQLFFVGFVATSITGQLTAEDLLRLHSQGVKGELIEGVLVETVAAGAEHSFIAVRLLGEMGHYARQHRLGWVGGTDGGVLVERSPDTVREPDGYFVAGEWEPVEEDADGYLEVVPKLVVEIVSPGDSDAAVSDKIAMWLEFGVSMVLEVRRASRTIAVHRLGVLPVTLTGDDALDGGDVLPGFSLPLSEIFDV